MLNVTQIKKKLMLFDGIFTNVGAYDGYMRDTTSPHLQK
jgi:hypothetical protein